MPEPAAMLAVQPMPGPAAHRCGALSPALLAVLLAVVVGAGCERRAAVPTLPGYVEGDWVYASAPVAGVLRELGVTKGTWVAAGAPLFSLDPEPEASVVAEARERSRAAVARLANLQKGLRPSEIAALAARLAAARAAVALSTVERDRATRLAERGVVPQAVVDSARSQNEKDLALVAQLEAECVTATLGARLDDVRAAEADVAAAAAQGLQAQWRLDQKRQTAAVGGLVQDTLFRVGEWAPAGAPVVVLLPPANVKVRVFVPETLATTLTIGQALGIRADGLPERRASVRFVSSQAEFTPPVLFSRDNRSKLVFLVEAVLEPDPATDPAVASPWKPGLPVDVRF